MATKNVHGPCSVPWSIISYHLECNSVPSPLASCELVARPGGGFCQPLPVASPSKTFLHEEREGDSGHVKFLLVLALSYRRGSLGQHLCRLPWTARSPAHHHPALSLFSRARITIRTAQLLPSGDAAQTGSCQRAEGHRGQQKLGASSDACPE